jgi:predicted SPOUT superfamily RNA methylase MTH1
LRGMETNRSYKLSIAIPSSFTAETADPKLRAYKVGQIARAAAVFRVDEITLYRDRRHPEWQEMAALLKYAETPQYLRKYLFRHSELLQYAGVLPPLRMPHHMVTSSIEEGQYREGVVLSHNGMIDVGSDECAWVDVGATSPLPLDRKMPAGRRITVRINSRDGDFWCTPDESPGYRGYRTTTHTSLSRTMARADHAIVTSVDGMVMTTRTMDDLGGRLKGSVLVVFGGPGRSVRSILADEKRSISEFTDAVFNLVPHQGSATVRTEEAVFAALALLNVADRTRN